MGWGAILELVGEDGARTTRKTSGRWGEQDDSGEQAHREACGTLRALETFLQAMQGKIILHLTDCVPVSSAMGAGSKESEVLHLLSVQIWKLCVLWSVHFKSMWISRDEMVKNGCDTLSRDATVDKHDVRVSDVGDGS
eukprot:1570266-Rhodomonas_salina.1